MNWLRTNNHSHSDERQQPEHDLHRSRHHFLLQFRWYCLEREGERERVGDLFTTVGSDRKKPLWRRRFCFMLFIYLPFLSSFAFLFWSNLCNACFSKSDRSRTRNSKSPTPGLKPQLLPASFSILRFWKIKIKIAKYL
jgi:hypothetical protein